MTGLDDRKKAFENKFALDEALMFKAEARCCKLFGLWLADKMGLSEDRSKVYASSVISANLEEPGFDDVKRAVLPDIEKHNLAVTEEEIDSKLAEFFAEAQRQIKTEA